jgi:hypothetical protein
MQEFVTLTVIADLASRASEETHRRVKPSSCKCTPKPGQIGHRFRSRFCRPAASITKDDFWPSRARRFGGPIQDGRVRIARLWCSRTTWGRLSGSSSVGGPRRARRAAARLRVSARSSIVELSYEPNDRQYGGNDEKTKTQASLPSEEAVLFLLLGLLRSGQVRLRRLVGWQDLTTPQMEAA